MSRVMRAAYGQVGMRHAVWGALAAAVALVSPVVIGQGPPEPMRAAQEPGARQPLDERQRAIQERIERLEGRLLKLARLLAEEEPDKAERLRGASEQVGARLIKRRIEQLVALLRVEQLSDAEQEQAKLLTDLEAVLRLLTDTLGDLERRRAERARLETHKRAIRVLMQEQIEEFQRTAEAGERSSLEREQMGAIEAAQRETEQKAAALERDMQPAGSAGPPPAGRPQVAQARQHMQRAADRLGEMQPGEAQEEQKPALEQLQRALDELEDALRQVRREETEETLTALELRFRSMLTREQQVRAGVGGTGSAGILPARPLAPWPRAEEQELAALAEVQTQVAEDCRVTLRILVEEGTTVILPDLVRRLADDMDAVRAQLVPALVSAETTGRLDDIIQVLIEIVAAIESKRAQDQQMGPPGPDPSSGQTNPLLPASAELKVLRVAQLRLNQQTAELVQRHPVGWALPTSQSDEATKPRSDEGSTRPTAADDAGTGSAGILPAAAELQRLAERQGELAELARRMNERK